MHRRQRLCESSQLLLLHDDNAATRPPEFRSGELMTAIVRLFRLLVTLGTSLLEYFHKVLVSLEECLVVQSNDGRKQGLYSIQYQSLQLYYMYHH